jgi:hypothetical protein
MRRLGATNLLAAVAPVTVLRYVVGNRVRRISSHVGQTG